MQKGPYPSGYEPFFDSLVGLVKLLQESVYDLVPTMSAIILLMTDTSTEEKSALS